MTIISTKLSFQVILEFLRRGDDDFHPSLSQSIDILSYAKKLSKYANFVIVKEGDTIVGCIAYYTNNEERFIYISHYWVSSKYQHNHYGQKMLETLIADDKVKYNEVRLEVLKDNPAFLFYKKNGFEIKENRENKYLLALSLK